MIDLHLHFDGSLLPRTVLELADEQGIALPSREPDELKLFLSAPADCASLNEYLEKFDLPLLVLQTKEAIRKGMFTLASSLKEQGMLYAEIRFAPQLHTRKGLTQEQIVKAALQGLGEAMAGSFFKAKLILCCMRGAENWQERKLCTLQGILLKTLALLKNWASPLPFMPEKRMDRRACARLFGWEPAVLGMACVQVRMRIC